jgi:hypothetical protein
MHSRREHGEKSYFFRKSDMKAEMIGSLVCLGRANFFSLSLTHIPLNPLIMSISTAPAIFRPIGLALLLLFPTFLSGQCPPEGDPTAQDTYLDYSFFEDNLNRVLFTMKCKPPIPERNTFGHYRYFWDFGDGTYALTTEDFVYHEYLMDGDHKPKGQIAKAYTDDKDGLAVLRVGRGQTGEEPIISIPVRSGETTYSDGDAYQPVGTGSQLVGLEVVRDIVPGYLSAYVVTVKRPCPGATSGTVYFSYPKGALATGLVFPNPEEGGTPAEAYVPAPDGPADFSDFVSPAHISMASVDLVGDDEFEEIEATIPFSATAADDSLYHFFVSLYASPFLEVGEMLDFKVQMTPCGGPLGSEPSMEILKSKPVSGSHDPNYKQVAKYDEFFSLPPDEGPQIAYVTGSQPTRLLYRLVFQNEGDQPAFNVTVTDTLSEYLDFNTFKLLGIRLAETNVPKNLCDYPPFLRDYLLSSPSIGDHFYEMTKDPAARSVSWTFKTDIPGLGMEDKDGNPIDTLLTYGVIEFEIYTRCELPEQVQFLNRAGVVFEEQEPVFTNWAVVRKLCRNEEFIYAEGGNFELDLLKVARQRYPNVNFDPRSLMVARSQGGIRFPGPVDTTRQGSPLFSYNPDPDYINQLDSFQVNKGRQVIANYAVDPLQFVICDVDNECYPLSVFLVYSKGTAVDFLGPCDGDCTPAPPVKEPWPKWIYVLLGLGLLLLILLGRLFRRKRGN